MMKCYHLALLALISFFLARPYVLSSYALKNALLSSPFANGAQGAKLNLQALNSFLSSAVKSSLKAGLAGVAGVAGVPEPPGDAGVAGVTELF
jgi:hypothetical protein